MTETLQAVYLRHARSEHEYREWVILPAVGQVPVNVWTRFVPREGARPVWRGSKLTATADAERRRERSENALGSVASTIAGHMRQNERNRLGRQWVWDAPIVVEVTADEVVAHSLKTPYPVLRRVEKVQRARKAARPTTS